MGHVVIELNVAQDFERLKPIECPKRGLINFPCVICQECEIGEVTMTSGDGYMVENTVNSVLIHLELNIQPDDPLEKAALKSLKNSLSEKIPAIQRGDWELGEFQIMITNDMISSDKLIVNNVSRFVEEFPRQFRQLMITAKRTLSNWSDKEAGKYAHLYFKEVSI